MRLSRHTARRSRRAATLAIVGAAAILAAAWTAPHASAAVAAWLHAPPVKTRTLAVADRLVVARAASVESSPGAARAAARAGPADVAPRPDTGPRSSQTSAPAAVTLEVGADFTMVGVMCDVPVGDGVVDVLVRTSLDGRRWSRWYEGSLEVAADGAGAPRAVMDAMWTGAGRYVQVSARAAGARAPLALTGVRLMVIDPGGGGSVGDQTVAAVRRVVATVAGASLTSSAAAAVPQPTWVTRAGWGADESLRSGTPVTAPLKMAFVHHTAGGNTYAQADASALVRGIYAYHTRGLGWKDIGYNFLIDRFGTIYVGRAGGPGKGVVGAQVYGFNTGSTGVSIMGTHTSTTPSAPSMDALERLLAWKLELNRLDPAGTATMTCGGTEKFKAGVTVSLPVIAGHRDANYTECPGDALYAQLPALRRAVAQQVKQAEPWIVTLSVPGDRVEVGTAVTYTGTVTTGAGASGLGTVTVQKRRASGGSWIDWRTATLADHGAYGVSVTMTSRQSWQFRTRMLADGDNVTAYSPIARLSVGPPGPWSVTLTLPASRVRVNTTVTYKGTVTAAAMPGSGTVTLQKRRASGGPWVAWRGATLNGSGAYAVSVRMTNRQSWQFRTRMSGDGDTLTGYSAVRLLKVQ